MAKSDPRNDALQHLSILQDHVLDPLATAERLAKKERAYVITERDAFAEFVDEVERLSVVTNNSPATLMDISIKEEVNQRAEDLRRAYNTTVMSTSHYSEDYGETLEENITEEFGAEIAELFRADSAASFNTQHKELLINAAEKQATHRENLQDALDSEIASLQSMHTDISMLLGTLDNSTVPTWYCGSFLDGLEEIQTSRQSALFSRSLPSGYDGHTLCSYLYEDKPWTYPGLTAVTRLLGSVVLQDRS